MSALRRITRTSGRRLYDEEERRQTTLDRIAELIKEGTDVTVLDHKDNRDITSSVLIQIIEKMAGQGVPILTQDVLRDLIRLRPQESATPQPSQQSATAQPANGTEELRIVNSSGLAQVATEN